MEIVGAALGHQGDLRARRSSFVRVVVRGRDPELLHRIRGHRQHRRERVPFRVRVDIHPVQRDVALIAVSPIHGSAPRVVVCVDVRTIAGIRDACLQRKQIRYVAPFHRQLLDLVLVKSVSQRSIRGIQRHRLPGYLHRLQRRTNLHFYVRSRRRIDQQLQIGLLKLPKARHFHREHIATRRK